MAHERREKDRGTIVKNWERKYLLTHDPTWFYERRWRTYCD